MPRSRPPLPPAELRVLKALWQVKSGTVAEVREAYAALHQTEPAYTTVMTLLGRLATKGAVRVDKSREPYIYKPVQKQESVLRERLRQFIETVFDGRPADLLAHLVDEGELTPDDLRKLEERIHSREKARSK